MAPDPAPVRNLSPLRRLLPPGLALGALLLVNAVASPHFFAVEIRDGRLFGTIIDVLNHGAKIAIVALGMTLVVATGGVDLSVGAVMAITGAVAARLVTESALPFPLVILAALSAAAACGACNGLLVTRLRIQPIVATLVLMVAGRGIAQLVTSGLIITFEHHGLASFANSPVLGLPAPVALALGIATIVAVVTRHTALGLFIESVGNNPEAARLAGLSDRRIKSFAYVAAGLLAGVAGLVECAYIKAADANNAGLFVELDAILAVVIGGTALTGGRFNLVGTLLGALFIQTLTKTLYLNDVSADVAPLPKALAVLAVCMIQSPAVRESIAQRMRRATR